MTNIEDKYDFVGEYHQGVAIVVKDGMYGAILRGGQEIFEPRYDYISAFKDGYAQAIRKGECRILNLSGNECKKYEGNFISISAKYDSVREFKNGHACVQLNDKWGVIDTEGKEIFEPQFYFISDFVGGTAKYKNHSIGSWGFVNVDGFCSECNLNEPEIEPNGNLILNESGNRFRINNKGHILLNDGSTIISLPKVYIVAKEFKDGYAIVKDNTGYWGVINKKCEVVVPLQYNEIHDFSENKAFALNKNDKLCLISINGNIIKVFDTYTDGKPFQDGFAIVSENWKHGVINEKGEELLAPLSGYIDRTDNPYVFKISLDGKKGLFNASTGLLIKPRYKRIIEVRKDCVSVEVNGISESLVDLSGRAFITPQGVNQRIYLPEWCIAGKNINNLVFSGVSDEGKWGLIDSAGNTLLNPEYDNIGEINGDIIPLEKKENYRGTKYGCYNIKSKRIISVIFDKCPEYTNDFYKVTYNGLLGVINGKGNVIIKASWNQISLYNEHFLISKKKKDYYDDDYIEFGVANKKGEILFKTECDDFVILQSGLYKISNHSYRYSYNNKVWYIYNNVGKLTEESFDEINIEGNYIAVSKDGRKGLLNESAEKIIKTDDGNYIKLPSKFTWGYNFKDGIAKVIINGFENYVDESFNFVIINDTSIIHLPKSIDYLTTKDSLGNYIFVSNEKYGIVNNKGKIIIAAKYENLESFVQNLYIAKIANKNDNSRELYGVIDIKEKTVIPFDYFSIEPYKGYVPSYDRPRNEEVEITNEIQYWLICKDGYGLIDSNGKICIPPIYQDIEQVENKFIVKLDEKKGLINHDFNTLIEPNYNKITPIGNGFWKVEIKELSYKDYYNEEHYTYKFGIINSLGEVCLEPIYNFIGDVNDTEIVKGRAFIKNGRVGLVDECYRILAQPEYNIISNFENGKATVSKYVFNQDENRDILIKGELDINGNFTEEEKEIKIVETLKNGFKVIQEVNPSQYNNYCAVVDNNNSFILPYKYHKIEELENGLFRVKLKGDYGLLDQDFNELIEPKYSYLRQIQNIYNASKYDFGHHGLIDSQENVILEFEYDNIESATPGLIWIYSNHKIGLATTTGQVLFTPQFGKKESLQNGYIKVNDGHWYEYDETDDEWRHKETKWGYSEGKWGIINTDGCLILPTIYDSIEIWGRDHFVVTKTISNIRVKGIVNNKGEQLVKLYNGNYILASKKYDWQDDFNSQDRSRVYHNGHIGFVNKEFQQIVTYKHKQKESEFILHEDYDWGYNSTTELIIIEKDNKKGFINSEGLLIISPKFDIIDELNYENIHIYICCTQDKNYPEDISKSTWSILNSEGEIITESLIEEPIYIGYSLIAIKSIDNKYHIIDIYGKPTTDTYFDSVREFNDFEISLFTPTTNSKNITNKKKELDFAIVEVGGKYGIINNLGNLIIPPKFSSLIKTEGNLFLADGVLINSSEQSVSFKDNLNLIKTDAYETIEILDNGLIIVSKNNLFGCINQVGTTIIPLKYRSLEYKNNLLIATIYDKTDDSYKDGVINFQEKQIVPFSKQIYDIQIESDMILYRQDGRWGAYSLQGQSICKPIYDHIKLIADNLIKVANNYNSQEKWGLIDNSGHELLPLEYSEIGDDIYNGLLRIYEGINNDYKGFVDITGHILLEPTYSYINSFVDGYAIVQIKKHDRNDNYFYLHGVINSQMIEVIPCVFFEEIKYEKETGRFHTGDNYITTDGRFIIEVDGKELYVDNKYAFCEPFNDKCAIAVQASDNQWDRTDFKYGLIDKKSNDILPPIFSKLELLDNGLYKFCINNLWGLVNSDGNIIIPNKYNDIKKIEENLIRIQINKPNKDRKDENRIYGLVDYQGNEILSPNYEFIGKVHNNISVVRKNNVWELFNILRKQIISIPNAAYLGPCISNLCRINIGGTYDKKRYRTDGGLWGYTSTDGQVVIEPIYEEAKSFSGRIAATKLNGKWGIINTNGENIVPYEYNDYELFEYDEDDPDANKGKCQLVKDGKIFVFDENGTLIESYDKEDDYDYYSYEEPVRNPYDSPYYNDNLDMDQQSQEFWDSL
ncbi:WG repeat-containing protein [Pseudoprevotella muciniphila]|uniref:WG repeat-containing protein n=1 Tax=Pseudoprevotella muciniphila TaxID=2133944 RepID=A0A5P8E4V8_9BACT|nr:WG repeat-containing protein [Pseudoprevotella muciniphila]QFQ12069.1 WG repeat-containing protein [Pseudoprevotella muciniphila]